jgi:hypothetical protein
VPVVRSIDDGEPEGQAGQAGTARGGTAGKATERSRPTSAEVLPRVRLCQRIKPGRRESLTLKMLESVTMAAPGANARNSEAICPAASAQSAAGKRRRKRGPGS